MDTSVLHIRPHIRQKHLYLLRTPSQSTRKQRHGQTRQLASDIVTTPKTQLLVIRIRRPPVRRPPVNHLGDIDEPSINHLLLVLFRALRTATKDVCRLNHETGPLINVGSLLERAVVALGGKGNVLTLDPSSGVEVVEALLEELGPVADGADEHAAVDKVELVAVGPFVFEVVDLE